jgi:hypothetical protein
MFPFPRTRASQWHAAIVVAGCLVILLWPLTPALAASDVLAAKVGTAMLTVMAGAASFLAGRRLRPRWRAALATAAGAGAVVLLIGHVTAASVCIGNHVGRLIVIGREYTKAGRLYIAQNPAETTSDHLLAAGGDVDSVWTAGSIARCRFRVSWGGLTAVPLFALALAALVWGRGAALAPPAVSGASALPASIPAATPIRYDAFISYRRLDKERAEALAEALEERGFQVAIDFRDFRPNVHVLTEMERCVLESRFVVLVITRHYLESGFTTEEARIAALLDAIERRNRIVPLMFERVPLPAWLQGLVGIDFTDAAQIDPMEKLEHLLTGARATPA